MLNKDGINITDFSFLPQASTWLNVAVTDPVFFFFTSIFIKIEHTLEPINNNGTISIKL